MSKEIPASNDYIYAPKEVDSNSQDETGCPTCRGYGTLPLTGDTCATCLGRGRTDIANANTFKITQGLTRGKYGSKIEKINPPRSVNATATGWISVNEIPGIPREIQDRYYEVYVE